MLYVYVVLGPNAGVYPVDPRECIMCGFERVDTFIWIGHEIDQPSLGSTGTLCQSKWSIERVIGHVKTSPRTTKSLGAGVVIRQAD